MIKYLKILFAAAVSTSAIAAPNVNLTLNEKGEASYTLSSSENDGSTSDLFIFLKDGCAPNRGGDCSFSLNKMKIVMPADGEAVVSPPDLGRYEKVIKRSGNDLLIILPGICTSNKSKITCGDSKKTKTLVFDLDARGQGTGTGASAGAGQNLAASESVAVNQMRSLQASKGTAANINFPASSPVLIGVAPIHCEQPGETQ